MTILTFYDHKTKERCLCKSEMISDDAVQVLSSGRTLKLENINSTPKGGPKVNDWNISSQALPEL